MSQIYLEDILIYPVKSFAGYSVSKGALGYRGLKHDRHWMLVDPQGQFLSQRKYPRMVLIQTELSDQTLRLTIPGHGTMQCQINENTGLQRTVTIWNDTCQALQVNQAIDQWISDFLGIECSLVYLPEEEFRQVDQNYAQPSDQTGFSDGFPLLLISQGSLEDLNSRLQQPVTMNRFRPNLVVSGIEPFAEDHWKKIRIGEVVFELVKPCSRCVMTTVNPETAEKGKEPLATLSQYRTQANKVMFGQNVLHRSLGELSVGMKVEILDE